MEEVPGKLSWESHYFQQVNDLSQLEWFLEKAIISQLEWFKINLIKS